MRYFLLSLALLLTSSVGLADGDGKQLFAQQWVMATAEGKVDAAIIAPGLNLDSLTADQFQVSLVSQDGKIYRAQPTANAALAMSFTGVPSGVYTLVARGPSLVACYAVHVLENSGDNVDPHHHMLAIAVSNLRLNKVRNAVIRYMPSSVPFVAEFDGAAGRTVMESLSQDKTFRVAQSGGGFSGRVFRAGLDGSSMAGGSLTNILVYQNRELVAQTVTDDQGKFTIDTLAPGQYGLVAIGPDGFAVIGFNLVDELVASSSRTQGQSEFNGRLVAFQAPSMQPIFEIQLAPSGLESPAMSELLDEGDGNNEPTSPPVPETAGLPASPAPMSGPVGGGGFTGGAGGAGGGGVGPLVGLAGLGIGAAVLASDDNNNGFATPPVVSPVTP